MAKQYRNALLLVKIQPTPGTDSVPTAALNAILCRGLKPQPLTTNFEERSNVQPYFGNQGSVLTASWGECEFEVEMQSAGTAGTAPKHGPLLRACAMAETLVAVTSAAYAPITTALEAVTLYYHLDGIRYILTDCRGTVAWSINARGIPVMKFKFIGLQLDAIDTAIPVGTDYSGFKDPVAVNFANTPTFTLHAIACKTRALEIDLANQLNYRNNIGVQGIDIVDRQPAGSVTFELDTVAVKNWTTTIKAGTLAPLSLIHGIGAGFITEFAAPKVQVVDYNIDETDGVAMVTAKLAFKPNAGNDELVVTFR